MDNYRPNSHKSKEEPVTNVISGSTKTRKKGKSNKLTKIFNYEDISEVTNYIFNNIFIPYLLRFLDDGFHAFLYHKRGDNYVNNSGYSNTNYRSYNTMHNSSSSRVVPMNTVKRPGFEYDDIVYEDYGDANLVLDTLRNRIKANGYTTVMDLYIASNRSQDCNYTFESYGWSDLRDARIVPVRDGYVIKLPRAFPIDERSNE